MRSVLGIVSIVVAGAVGLVTVFVLWRRWPAPAVLAVSASCGVAIAAGGILVQEDAGVASWVVALTALGVLAPVHARLLFGPPGPAGWLPPGRSPRRKGSSP